MSTAEQNMELMQTLDDAWNGQDVDTFAQRHKPDVVVRWPGKPPTIGIDDHQTESIEFWTAFPDQHLDNMPYKTFFASGEWTCSIARFTGTMTGLMRGPDGKDIPPTGKQVVFTGLDLDRIAGGRVVECWAHADELGLLQQLGVIPAPDATAAD